MSHKDKGFTIVEVAIVLAIIGLIIGGILTGINLIRNAQLQSIIKDEDRYKKAVQLFKEKYLYLPGDLPTATNFWGTDASCPNTPANTVPKTATCNGNGDGFIDNTNNSLSGNEIPSTSALETLRMWQHLANAGFIDGSYTGTFSTQSGEKGTAPGMNTPLSKISGATFLLRYVQPVGYSNLFSQYPANYQHVIIFGAPNPNQTYNYNFVFSPILPILTTTEAQSIDQKIDDGFPGTGNVMTAWDGGIGGCPPGQAIPGAWCCVTGGVTPPGAYQTSIPGNQCSLVFITGF